MNEKLVKYSATSQPCRNFNILGSTVVIDPKDGREKFVLSNFAAHATGNLVFIDTQTGEGESIEIPGDAGAWAIVNLNNEKIIIGTCPGFGYLHCLDLKSRIWATSLRDENEKYFWMLTMGSDGMAYGGTWPGAALLRYDPKNHVLENMGKASDNPKDMYTRPVFGNIPGYIIVMGGYNTTFISIFNIETKTFKVIDRFDPKNSVTMIDINEDFFCVKITEDLKFYSSKTFEILNDPELKNKINKDFNISNVLKDGRIAGVKGQDYYIKQKSDEKPELKRIPVPAPATHIHTITSDENGKIWGACGFGQTIFSYDPTDDSYWNSSNVSKAGGEVYGMVFINSKLYLTSYVGGDHTVYDPCEPWDQLNNINPKSIKYLSPELIRPLSRSVRGPENTVWTGWSANYGTYGGGLSCIYADTNEVDYWLDPIPGQEICSISVDNEYVYISTDGNGNGLPNRDIPCHFGVCSFDGKLIYDKIFEKPIRKILAIDGIVFASSGDELLVFKPETLEFIKTISIGQNCSCILAIDNITAALFCKNELYFINTKTFELKYISELPGHVDTAVLTPTGDLYFAHGTTLYKMSDF